MIREQAFVAAADRAALLARLPEVGRFQELVAQLWTAYDALVEQEEHWRKQLIGVARLEEVVQRFQAVPGYGWLRAVTFYAYVDTPWRFRSKAALWKYLGVGLQRQHSGNGPEYLGVPVRTHRLLKNGNSSAVCSDFIRQRWHLAGRQVNA